MRPARNEAELAQLEAAYAVLDLYVWLSYRLEDAFPGRTLALQQRAGVAALVEEALPRILADPDAISRRCGSQAVFWRSELWSDIIYGQGVFSTNASMPYMRDEQMSLQRACRIRSCISTINTNSNLSLFYPFEGDSRWDITVQANNAEANLA